MHMHTCSLASSTTHICKVVLPPAPHAPEQLVLEMPPVAGVVQPDGQLWQAGLGVTELPPADQVPRSHAWQLVPP